MGLPTSYQLSLVLMLMLVGIFHVCLGSPLPQTDTATQDGTHDGEHLTTFEAGSVKVRWHPEPKGRGTVGILVSCTATYIFCIWTSIHPNIMPETTKTCRTFYKMVLTFVSIVLPPGIMVCSMGELYDACQVLKAWNKQREEWREKGIIDAIDDSNALGLSGAFFIVMGGFVVQKVEVPKQVEKTKGQDLKQGTQADKQTSSTAGEGTTAPDPSTGSVSSPGADSIYPSTIHATETTGTAKPEEYHGSEIQKIRPKSTTLLGLSQAAATKTRASEATDICWSTLTPEGFINYLEAGNIGLGSFEKRDMDDKGKANVIAKIFAFTQALWMIVQAFARWRDRRHLPLSLLEVHVIIQVVCTSVIYACWWEKPLDVSEPLVMKFAEDNDKSIPNIKLKEVLEKQLDLSRDFVRKDANRDFVREDANRDSQNEAGGSAKPNLITTQKPTSDFVAVMIKAIFDITKHICSTKHKWYGRAAVIVEGFLVIVVGFLHLIVVLGTYRDGESPFPTYVEEFLWLLSCGGMMVFPFLVVFIDLFTSYEKDLFRILWEAPYRLERGIERTGGVKSTKRRSLIPYSFGEMHKMCTKRAGGPGFLRGILLIWHYLLLSTCVLFITLTFACSLFFTIESYIAMRNPTEILFETPRWVDFWPHI